jgi:murein DD-endopeptidase MepM/ murein hydrolase activator NlpD
VSPWLLTNELLDVNQDGIVTFNEAVHVADRLFANSQRIFLNDIKDTVPGLGRFGGCNTLRSDCPNYHPAVDAGGERGDPIRSATFGEVVAVDDVGGAGPNFGKYVVVKHSIHGRAFYSVYAHMDTQLVDVGDLVDNLTVLGTIGNTNGQGANNFHLHFEVRQSSNIDPEGFGSSVFVGTYWAFTGSDLHSGWVDLGSIYGYHAEYPASWERYP